MRALVLSLSLFALLGTSFTLQRAAKADLKQLEWWQQSVVYQIYPRSFQDSDGDGIGDLNGISSRLDYLVGLGIDAVWVSPFYKSPMKDFGYDIADFKDVDPIFGTLDDFKNMTAEFQKRGLKLIMDMVPNHSSDLHEWFNKSINRVEPYTDYYMWKDANGTDADGKPIPPNNWVSVFGGSAWEWNDQRQQFYLHQFDKGQPDFNYTNIAVRNEILAIVKYWLDLGVDGFRVDAVAWIYEDAEWRDEPLNPNRDPAATPDQYDYLSHVYTYNLPGVPVFLADMRQLLDVYSAADGRVRCMMVEAGVEDDSIASYYGTVDKPVSHFPFNFHLLQIKPTMNATEILKLIDVWYEILPEHAWATFLLGNHDQKRAPTRWTNGSIDGANMINLLLQGTAVTYQGEELGMTDTFLTWEETQDPQACNQDPDRYLEFSRDPSRTPFHWNNKTQAGFSTANKTWLPINPNYVTVNVETELAEEESHLKVYIELLKLRNTDTWRYGSYESHAFNEDRILGFTRMPPEGVESPGLLVLVNLSDDDVTADTSIFGGLPAYGTIATRSVNFKNQAAVVGSQINIRSMPLGPRDSIVLQFN